MGFEDDRFDDFLERREAAFKRGSDLASLVTPKTTESLRLPQHHEDPANADFMELLKAIEYIGTGRNLRDK